MPDAKVAIDPSMAHHFQLEAWDALDDGGKLALGDYLSERLQAHGWEVSEPMALRPFGPPGELRSVLQWREPTSGMTFSFIPGGTFQPGYDEAQLARLRSLQFANGHGYDDEDADEMELMFQLKARVKVPPLFMATELVRPSLSGLRSVVTLPEESFGGESLYGYEFMGDAIEFPWKQVEPILAAYGWSLPTSAEFEWALRGGNDWLFYWGNDLPKFMEDEGVGWRKPLRPDQADAKASFDAIMSASFAPERGRTWPWCNRFGLAAMLPRETWCARSTDPHDPEPLVLRGGAAHLCPWQGSGEWRALLSAIESRYEDKLGYAAGAVRPVIRLEVGA